MITGKGGLVSDITVGDCIELTAALEEHHFRGSAGRPLFYALLKETGVLPASAPLRLRALRIEGRRSVEQIVDAYGIECRAVRDLLVEYFTERAPELDHVSLRSIARNLCRLFWRDLEIHHPGIDSLRLTPEVAKAWKERLAFIRDAQGQPVRERVNFRSELVFVRAFYQDIARWAADDPARWAPWVAPCPIKANECATKKSRSRVKSRMDQRTRTQLPLLPALLRAVERQRKDAEARITAARAKPAGGRFLCLVATSQSAQITVAGDPLEWRPHDFRRIFVTDTIRSGLPPHIAAKICGHAALDTTMGYAAIYPEDVISHHRAFIARRRTERPSEEYRELTATEWDEFLAHFELRKVALGTCGRDYATPCQHENACVRCPLLLVDPAQMPRLQEIHANLVDRLQEARPGLAR
ncbi:tyrosine-type recombinase/integrase [Streptomyces sp. NPDC005786]|uniref:tyrosine-type recombinase/integrase n=1 Tax=Streptomyces sp. NPDC005786 TaxID=3154891 RepID=UPI00340CFC18